MSITSRFKHAFDAFISNSNMAKNLGRSDSRNPNQVQLSRTNEKSISAAGYTRIAIDASQVDIRHVRVDENDRFTEEMDSYLTQRLTFDPNIDQTPRAFFHDVVMTMFDAGVAAVVPTNCTTSPLVSDTYEIKELRVGRIIEWFPKHVRVNVYNSKSGQKEEIILPKKMVAIIQNPFYSIMNEPNSTYQRLVRKLNLLDAIDTQSASGKLDLLIQLPYVVNTPMKEQRAEERRRNIENQLEGSKYGIAYIDGTERVTQLNRPSENNLMAQVEYLTNMFYNQLGIPKEVFEGTADEATMLNYNNRALEPVLTAITEEMTVKFLTKTARTQGQRIKFFRDPFKLVPVSQVAEIADKFTRNEILSSNDIRSIIGYKPSKDPRADELRNKNLNADKSDQLPRQLPNETTSKIENSGN